MSKTTIKPEKNGTQTYTVVLQRRSELLPPNDDAFPPKSWWKSSEVLKERRAKLQAFFNHVLLQVPPDPPQVLKLF